MSFQKCCVTGFEWQGTPTGRIEKVADIDTYVAGSNPDAAVLIIHDLFGWSFPNVRLLADHYAHEANASVYVPDFFLGDELPTDLVFEDKFDQMDLAGFMAKHGRAPSEPRILAVARALRERHARLGAVGFCYGGWAVFRLGATEHTPPLVDCITAAHPSLLTAADVEAVGVPVQLLAPEIDPVFTQEMKELTFRTLLGKGLAFEYVHFPGVAHSCMIRGDEKREGERAAMARGKNAAVQWLEQYLHPSA